MPPAVSPKRPFLAPRHRAALALLAGWAVFFGRHLLTDVVPYYRDLLLTYHPLRHYLHERLRAGELPQWYPYETLGVPLIGQVVTALFHPQTLLLLPFDPLTAIKLNVLLAYLLAAAGGYRLARAVDTSRVAAVTGGLALAFGGYALGMSNNQPYLLGVATLPWVGWAALRLAQKARAKDAAVLALCWAPIFLGGDAQTFALAPLMLVAALAVHGLRLRPMLLMILAGVTTALLAGVEFLPATAVSAQSARGLGEASPTLGVTWALAPWRIPELLIPGYVPDPVRFRVVGELFGGGTALWSSSLFAGASVMLAAAAGVVGGGRRAWAFLGVAALSFWLALGDHGGLLPIAWKVLPVLSKFRFPEKYLAVFWVALVPLTALGIDAVRRRPLPWALAAAIGGVLLGVLGTVAGGGDAVERLWAARGHFLPSDDAVLAHVPEAWALGLWSSAGFLLAVALVTGGAKVKPALALAFPLLVFAELWLGNGGHVPTVPRALLADETAFGDLIRRSADGARPPHRVIPEAVPAFYSTVTLGDGPHWVGGMRHVLRPDASGISGVTAFGSNLPATSLRDALLFGRKAVKASRWGALFDGCFRVADYHDEDPHRSLRPGDQPLIQATPFKVMLVRQPCRPRAYLAGATGATDPFHALERMEAGLPPDHVVWEGGPDLPPADGTIRWLEHAPERLRLEVEADARTALVVAEAFAAGWTATLDGAPAAMYPVNVAGRGLEVPAGRHLVEMRYRTPRLGLGLASTGLGLLLVVGLLLGSRKWRPAGRLPAREGNASREGGGAATMDAVEDNSASGRAGHDDSGGSA